MTEIESEVVKTDVLGRITLSKAQREKMLDAFEQSGLSAALFAKQYGVKQQTFASWIQKRRRARGDYENEELRRKLRMRKGGSKQPLETKSESLQLIEVKVEDSVSQPSASLEILLPNGAKVQVSEESQIPLLKTLMRELSC